MLQCMDSMAFCPFCMTLIEQWLTSKHSTCSHWICCIRNYLDITEACRGSPCKDVFPQKAQCVQNGPENTTHYSSYLPCIEVTRTLFCSNAFIWEMLAKQLLGDENESKSSACTL